ncbi:anthranilate phosphoribosyltransferase family protein [Trichothermofontia sp.]
MSQVFRDLLRKIGSGEHTSQSLSREEARLATELMLRQEATPAQIGAFLIAHRIKRPTPDELAGMLDAYDVLGPALAAIATDYPVMVFGSPYDGRSRTAPLSPLTSLILSAAGCPVLLHGGRQMPTKYGVPLVDLWQALGVDWTGLSLAQVQQALASHHLALLYLPQHFPLADGLVTYRDEIGKRPPLATVELIWCPYRGAATIVAGFVHPPTESYFWEALALRGCERLVTVKGLEGSCDLPRQRTGIVATGKPGTQPERLLLHPRDYGMAGPELPYTTLSEWAAQAAAVLRGEWDEMAQACCWNAGFYLWQAGVSTSLQAGMALAEQLLQGGQVARQWESLRENRPMAGLKKHPQET